MWDLGASSPKDDSPLASPLIDIGRGLPIIAVQAEMMGGQRIQGDQDHPTRTIGMPSDQSSLGIPPWFLLAATDLDQEQENQQCQPARPAVPGWGADRTIGVPDHHWNTPLCSLTGSLGLGMLAFGSIVPVILRAAAL